MEASKETLMEDEQREDGAGGDRSTASKVYRLIRDMFDKGKKGKKRRFAGKKRFGRGPDRERDMDIDADSDDEEDGTVSMVDVRARVLAAGFTEMDLMSTINEVSQLFLLSQQEHPLMGLNPTVRGIGNSHASREWYQVADHQQDLTNPRICLFSTFCITVPHFVLCFLRSCPRCCLSGTILFFCVSPEVL